MPQVDLHAAFEEGSPGRPSVRRYAVWSPTHEQIRMEDVVALAVGHHQAERLEGLLTEGIAEFLGGHGDASSAARHNAMA